MGQNPSDRFSACLWTRNWLRVGASNRQFGAMLAEDLGCVKVPEGKAEERRCRSHPDRASRQVGSHHDLPARPGVVIGKKGEDIENLKVELAKRLGVPVAVNIEEVRKPEIDAQLIADSITQQLEKRIMFRRAMKRAMQNAMRLGAQGIKIMSAGRLNGIEIARTEWYTVKVARPAHLRADIDYGTSEAKTTYGAIGVKVWVYRGIPGPWRSPGGWRRASGRRSSQPSWSSAMTVRAVARAVVLVAATKLRLTAATSLQAGAPASVRKGLLTPRKENKHAATLAVSSGKEERVATPVWQTRGNTVAFGEFGLKATERGRITARQIEAARRAISRHVKRGGRIFIRSSPTSRSRKAC